MTKLIFLFALFCACVSFGVDAKICCPPPTMQVDYDQLTYNAGPTEPPANVSYVIEAHDRASDEQYRYSTTQFETEDRDEFVYRIVYYVEGGFLYSYEQFASQGPNDCWMCRRLPNNATFETLMCRETDDAKHVRVAGTNSKALEYVKSTDRSLSGNVYVQHDQALFAVKEPYCFPVSAASETFIKFASTNETSFTSWSANYYDAHPKIDGGLLDIPSACLKDPACALPPSIAFLRK
jgi:hypothetical protein